MVLLIKTRIGDPRSHIYHKYSTDKIVIRMQACFFALSYPIKGKKKMRFARRGTPPGSGGFSTQQSCVPSASFPGFQTPTKGRETQLFKQSFAHLPAQQRQAALPADGSTEERSRSTHLASYRASLCRRASSLSRIQSKARMKCDPIFNKNYHTPGFERDRHVIGESRCEVTFIQETDRRSPLYHRYSSG